MTSFEACRINKKKSISNDFTNNNYKAITTTDLFAPMLFLSGIYIAAMLLNRLILQPTNK